jgi:membrane protease YdiL (CAAX protease family)
MRKAVLLLFLSTCIFHASARGADSVAAEPEPIPGWTVFVPGASYFYQGKVIKGSVFSALEISGIALGALYDGNLKNESSSPYYNYPLWMGLQAYQTEKLILLKNSLEIFKHRHPGFQYDALSDRELFLSPFKAENFLTPITCGMVLLSGIVMAIELSGGSDDIRDVDRMYLLDRYVKRNSALPAFGAVSMAMSWGAGVGEEYAFRNYVMPFLDYRFGRKKGLMASSLIFGAGHFSNLMFSEKPDYRAACIQAVEATVAGYFLGRDVQNRNYKIGPAVAAHVWYDLTQMLGSFLIDPENNYLGVSVRFKM